MIVGHAVKAFLTIRRMGSGRFFVTQHLVTRELHATKGWRNIKHAARSISETRMPARSERNASTFHTFRRTERPAKETPDYNREITEKMLMRHSWYRRRVLGHAHSLVAFEAGLVA